MADNLVYVSFERGDYKINKSTLLKAKSDVINLQKRILKLKAIRSQKKRNHEILQKIMQAIATSSARLDEKLPEFKMPEELKSKGNKVENKIKKEKIKAKMEKVEKREKRKLPEDYLEDELVEINRKLRELNA
jgi:hypothetical protein